MAKSFLETISVNVENVTLDEPKSQSVFYNPKQVGDKPYEALIRFLPIPIKENGEIVGVEKDPYYMLKRYWLVDEMGIGNYYTSSLTIGRKDCPIQATFFKLYNSEDVRLKNLATSNFSISTHYWSPVYIIDDKQNPDLNGKVMIMRYTSEIKKLIDKELEESEYKKNSKVAVWDLLKGKNFVLKVGIKKFPGKDGKERMGKDYSKCEFLDIEPITINGYQISLNDPKSDELVKELLLSVPDEIYEYKYKEWDDETRKKVYSILRQYNPDVLKNKQQNTQSTQTSNENTSSSTLENPSSQDEMLDEADKILQDLDF